MTYHEKRSLVNIFSTVVLTGVYALVIYNKYMNGDFDLSNILRFWAIVILIFIPISIVARIVIMIIFSIGNSIGTAIKNEIKGEDEEPFEDVVDERDKLISLKATRISMAIFVAGFIAALISQLFDTSNHLFFIVIVSFGVLSDVATEIATIRYYRRGV